MSGGEERRARQREGERARGADCVRVTRSRSESEVDEGIRMMGRVEGERESR